MHVSVYNGPRKWYNASIKTETEMTATKNYPLPKGMIDKDVTEPKRSKKTWKPLKGEKLLDYPAYNDPGSDYFTNTLTMYYTERFGWCITTLQISRGKRGMQDRSYAVNMSGDLVRVGQGPHVLKTVNVYLRESRMKDLQPFLDLYNKGLAGAGDTRDRISTRRARGAMRIRSWF